MEGRPIPNSHILELNRSQYYTCSFDGVRLNIVVKNCESNAQCSYIGERGKGGRPDDMKAKDKFMVPV